MWHSKSLSGLLDINNQNDCDYAPREKKSKDSSDALSEAITCCRNQEIGIEEASLIYGIPKSTLRAKLKDSNCPVIDENYRVFVLLSFPNEAESELVTYLQDCIASHITMTAVEIRKLAYDLFCEKYKVSDLPKEKNCLLGQRWYKQFIEKYPHLNFENQMLRVNEDKSSEFYNSLEMFSNKFAIGAEHIYAVDGVELKFRASCADDMKVFHKRRTMYTNAKALCCINPTGDFVPPAFLKLPNSNILNLKSDELSEFLVGSSKKNPQLNKACDKVKEMCNSKNISDDLVNVEKQIKMHMNKKFQTVSEKSDEELREKLYEHFIQLKNKIITKCENSVNEITPEFFYNWFLGFINHVKPNPQKTVLLLLTNQNYIKTYKILELAKKNNVIFLILPPHSIHKIYPLDGFAMSLNRNLSVCTRRWLGRNPDFKAEQEPLDLLFMEAFNETKNPLIAKNGFLYSGIWPVNRTIFQSSELGGESVLLSNESKFNENCAMITADFKRNNLASFGITNESDLGKLCRVCMKEKMYMKPLLETFPLPGPNYHGKKISDLTKVLISYGDGLPSNICQYCLVQLIDTIKVTEMTIESHKKQLKLREALDRFYFEDDEGEDQDLMYLLSCTVAQINDSKIINRGISKNFDINSICRICMGEKPLMTSIFFRSQRSSELCFDICSKIMEISGCQVHIQDGLSSSICPFCRASVNKASEFIRRVLNSDKILKKIISQFRTKS